MGRMPESKEAIFRRVLTQRRQEYSVLKRDTADSQGSEKFRYGTAIGLRIQRSPRRRLLGGREERNAIGRLVEDALRLSVSGCISTFLFSTHGHVRGRIRRSLTVEVTGGKGGR